MITPAKVDLVAQRWTPFVDITAIEGFDLSAATFALQVRMYRDAPGAPLLSLVNAASNAQGISVSVSTEEDGFGVGVPTSSVQIRINETTLEGLHMTPNRDVTLVYDLHITGGGLPKTRMMEGAFIIRAGATQNG